MEMPGAERYKKTKSRVRYARERVRYACLGASDALASYVTRGLKKPVPQNFTVTGSTHPSWIA